MEKPHKFEDYEEAAREYLELEKRRDRIELSIKSKQERLEQLRSQMRALSNQKLGHLGRRAVEYIKQEEEQ